MCRIISYLVQFLSYGSDFVFALSSLIGSWPQPLYMQIPQGNKRYSNSLNAKPEEAQRKSMCPDVELAETKRIETEKHI